MKRLFLLLVVMALGVGAFGLYRGWWNIQSGGNDGKSGLTVTVDKDKIHDDKEKAVDTVHTVEHKVGASTP